MGEPKPLASLSSSLLARKGQAKPAMRPQGFASFGFGGSNAHDDLGWNDMGHDHGQTPASAEVEPISADVVHLVPNTPVEPPVVIRQQEELVRELTPEPVAEVVSAPVREPVFAQLPVRPMMPRAAAGSKGKAAFTLRLDPQRHLQLRLACAMAHKSAQALVVNALDNFLSQQPALAEMARAAAHDTVAK